MHFVVYADAHTHTQRGPSICKHTYTHTHTKANKKFRFLFAHHFACAVEKQGQVNQIQINKVRVWVCKVLSNNNCNWVKKSEAKSKTRGRTRILCIKRQMREIERVGKCVCVWDAAGWRERERESGRVKAGLNPNNSCYHRHNPQGTSLLLLLWAEKKNVHMVAFFL